MAKMNQIIYQNKGEIISYPIKESGTFIIDIPKPDLRWVVSSRDKGRVEGCTCNSQG
jgi:hypothetical protein